MEGTKKRVIICSTSDYAADYRLYKTTLSLTQLGFEVVRLGRHRKGHLHQENEGIRLMKMLFEKGPLFYLEMNIRLFLFLVLSKCHIIYSVDLDTLPGCRLAAMLRRKKLVFDSHEYFPEVPELKDRPLIKSIWLVLERMLVPGIHLGITVCHSIATIYKDKYGLPFYVVRNIPMAKRIQPSSDSTPPPRPFTLLYQGAVNEGRGLEPMIEAMPYLPQCRLVIVGDGPISQQIKELVEQKGLNTRVLIEGKKPYDQLPSYMAKADLGLVLLENKGLNYYYSLPNRLFDFMQAGLPILAMDFPEMAAIVNGYHVGLCVDNMEPEKLAQVIGQIIQNRDQMATWRKNMSQAAKELTWEHEYEVLLQPLLNL
ncbi:MAG: glycosyltransferase family 4 protein [Breznakibacter sp.]